MAAKKSSSAGAASSRVSTSKSKAAAKKAPTQKSRAAVAVKKAPAKAATKATKQAAVKAPAKKAAATRTAAKAVAKVATPRAKPKSTPATSTVAAAPARRGALKAPVKKASAAETSSLARAHFDAKFIEEQRASLIREKNARLQQADVLQAEADSLMADREPGDVQFDEESGEGDTLAVERERDLALSAQARAQVELIDAALERIEDGTYGICNQSGTPIPKERLRAIPWATERVEYKVGGFGRR